MPNLPTLGDVAYELIEKENRKDTFVNTAKSCAKAHASMYKKFLAGATKYITKNDKYAEKIMNISNKKVVAGTVALELCANYLLMKWSNNWGGK